MELQLKKLREQAGLTQEDMARKLKAKIRTYGSWERQEVSMSFPTAIKCCDILGCTLDELAGYAPKPSYKYAYTSLDYSDVATIPSESLDVSVTNVNRGA